MATEYQLNNFEKRTFFKILARNYLNFCYSGIMFSLHSSLLRFNEHTKQNQ